MTAALPRPPPRLPLRVVRGAARFEELEHRERSKHSLLSTGNQQNDQRGLVARLVLVALAERLVAEEVVLERLLVVAQRAGHRRDSAW